MRANTAKVTQYCIHYIMLHNVTTPQSCCTMVFAIKMCVVCDIMEGVVALQTYMQYTDATICTERVWESTKFYQGLLAIS